MIDIETQIELLWEDYFRTDNLHEREDIRTKISTLELKIYRKHQRIPAGAQLSNIKILR